MTDPELRIFVLLKYEILTSNSSTWDRCEAKYPESVKSNWAWRCAADVEHIAKGYPEAEECIRIAKLCRDGEVPLEELNAPWDDLSLLAVDGVYYAVSATYCAAVGTIVFYAATTANRAVASYAAAYAANRAVASYINREEKWKVYIEWLIEELCEYESTKENINDT